MGRAFGPVAAVGSQPLPTPSSHHPRTRSQRRLAKAHSYQKAVCADAGYRGAFETFMKEEFGLPVHISERIKDGFAVIPRRWVVERSFAWFNGQRRLSKDYERNCLVSESMIYIASISRPPRACVN